MKANWVNESKQTHRLPAQLNRPDSLHENYDEPHRQKGQHRRAAGIGSVEQHDDERRHAVEAERLATKTGMQERREARRVTAHRHVQKIKAAASRYLFARCLLLIVHKSPLAECDL
jgi:hypothetical protein